MDVLSRAASATVKVAGYPSDLEKVGLGVLAGNGFLVTAAHCLEYDHDTAARILLGERVHYGIETARGEALRVSPVYIESISDIAVLGPVDRREFPEEWARAYEWFRKETEPVPLSRGRPPEEFDVRIFTHEKRWIPGKASTRGVAPPDARIRTGERIEGGSSGGAIVNDAGELVGVVTAAAGYLGVGTEGYPPLLRHALPAWIFRRICGPLPY